MKRIFYALLIFPIILFSCKTNEICEDCDKDNTDSLADTTNVSDMMMDIDTTTSSAVEMTENLATIEKKYGEQWDFCHCVVANDSVNKAFMKDNISDKEFNRLDLRSTFIMNKCQAFLGLDGSRSPDDRAKHERKVKKCLKDAGIKK